MAPVKPYNWKRFFCHRDASYSMSDGGFLADPDSDYGQHVNPHAKSIEQLCELSCFVLLGEPGIGKSTILAKAFEDSKIKYGKPGVYFHFLDLKDFGSDTLLIENGFHAPPIEQWRKHDSALHLFIDSLDIARLSIGRAIAIITRELKTLDMSRVNLRIGCRTAVWPKVFEDALALMYEASSNGGRSIFEVLPLRRIDVSIAALSKEIDPAAFVDEVERAGATPFAIKPITLDSLLRRYARGGCLPNSKTEIYEDGCLALCEENNEWWRESKLSGKLSANARLSIARRLAAITIFCDRVSYYTGAHKAYVLDAETRLSHVCGGIENSDAKSIPATEPNVEEVLGTGLFSSRGNECLGWSHQSYAEFLAGQYIAQSEMTIEQLKQLLFSSSPFPRRLFPQLHETAAWIASSRVEIFEEILTCEPEILLNSDVPKGNAEYSKRLVDSLLALLDTENARDSDFDWKRGSNALRHPNLSSQLAPYIASRRHNVFVRRAAIDIVQACQVTDSYPLILECALDITDEYSIRVHSAWAIVHCDDASLKSRLLPLATGTVGEDPDDELRGWGLHAVWPMYIDANTLFRSISRPQRTNLIGAYYIFLGETLPNSLSSAHLVPALRWVQGLTNDDWKSRQLDKLAQRILNIACREVLPGDLASELAKTILRISDSYWHPTEENDLPSLQHDMVRRRLILAEIVRNIKSADDEVLSVVHFFPFIRCGHDDIPWFIEQMSSSSTQVEAEAWSWLVFRLYDVDSGVNLDIILDACTSNSLLLDRFSNFLHPTDLNSESAAKAKTDWLHFCRAHRRPALSESSTPDLRSITKILDRIDAGEYSLWPNLVQRISRDNRTGLSGYPLDPDLSAMSIWEKLDENPKMRILAAARAYVNHHVTDSKEWLGKKTYDFGDLDGFKALLLLLEHDTPFLQCMSDATWENWATVVVGFPISSGLGTESKYHQLISLAYKRVPAKIIESVLVFLDAEDAANESSFVIRKLEYCWDNDLADALYGHLVGESLKSVTHGWILRALLSYGHEDSRNFAIATVGLRPYSDSTRDYAREAAAALLLFEPDCAWSVVWPAVMSDTQFGRGLFEYLTHDGELRGRKREVFKRLRPDDLACLYVWLAQQYPHRMISIDSEGGWVDAVQHVEWWRDEILDYLKNLGTEASISAINSIAVDLPELTWLGRTLAVARYNVRTKEWIPKKPHELLRIVHDSKSRIVDTPGDLRDVVIESLIRLEKKLHGSSPAVRDVWDRQANGKFRPKKEEELSDYIKRHFDEDLKGQRIVVNREVLVNSERFTDIHIVGHRSEHIGKDNDPIVVIVEVKGCWHRKLQTAMKTQLRDDYLCRHGVTTGIYLVAWSLCDSLDEKHSRRRNASFNDIEGAKEFFNAQAAELSNHPFDLCAYVLDIRLKQDKSNSGASSN
jgi:hypothetical protein